MVTISFSINADTPEDGAAAYNAILNNPIVLQAQLHGIEHKLDQIENEVKAMATDLTALQASVDNQTKEVAENNALLDQLEGTNATNAETIKTLTGQVAALTADNEAKAAILAGLDAIQANIDADAAALDARQPKPAPEPAPEG